MGFRICFLIVKNSEDFWVGMDGVDQQVLQKVNFGSHLKDGARETPGRVQVRDNKWGFKAPSEAAEKVGVALSGSSISGACLPALEDLRRKAKVI